MRHRPLRKCNTRSSLVPIIFPSFVQRIEWNAVYYGRSSLNRFPREYAAHILSLLGGQRIGPLSRQFTLHCCCCPVNTLRLDPHPAVSSISLYFSLFVLLFAVVFLNSRRK